MDLLQTQKSHGQEKYSSWEKEKLSWSLHQHVSCMFNTCKQLQLPRAIFLTVSLILRHLPCYVRWCTSELEFLKQFDIFWRWKYSHKVTAGSFKILWTDRALQILLFSTKSFLLRCILKISGAFMRYRPSNYTEGIFPGFSFQCLSVKFFMNLKLQPLKTPIFFLQLEVQSGPFNIADLGGWITLLAMGLWNSHR